MGQFHTPREWLVYCGGILGFQNDWEELVTFDYQGQRQSSKLKNYPTQNNKSTFFKEHWSESNTAVPTPFPRPLFLLTGSHGSQFWPMKSQ